MKIRINESTLKAIVAESVKRILKENEVPEWHEVKPYPAGHIKKKRSEFGAGWEEREIAKQAEKYKQSHPEYNSDIKHFQFVGDSLRHDDTPSGRLSVNDRVARAASNNRSIPLPYEEVNSSDEINNYLERMSAQFPEVKKFVDSLKSETNGETVRWGKFNFNNVNFRTDTEMQYWMEKIHENYWGAKFGTKLYKFYYSPIDDPNCIRIGVSYDDKAGLQLHFGVNKLDRCLTGKEIAIDY